MASVSVTEYVQGLYKALEEGGLYTPGVHDDCDSLWYDLMRVMEEAKMNMDMFSGERTYFRWCQRGEKVRVFCVLCGLIVPSTS